MRRCTILPLLAACVLAVATSGSARAGQAFSFGQDVDPSVVAAVSGQPGGDYHLLVFGNNLSQADGSVGVSARDDLDPLGAQSVEVDAAQAAALAAQPGVQYVTTDTPMAPTGMISPQGAVSAASLATIYPQVDGAPALWAQGITGAGVGIAVIDSGVTPRADFGSRLVQVDLPGQAPGSLADGVGHGSAVAGVAAGESPDGHYIGVAPGAQIYAINVARSDGVYTSDVIAGLDWVLANARQDNIRVVNLSLSQTVPSSYLTNTLDAAVEVLWRAGIVVVTSAGNFGPNSEDFAPANDPYVITVGASDDADTLSTADDTLASFSSYGTTPDGFQKPEIVAPGMHIVTTLPAGSEIAGEAPAGYLSSDGGGTYVRISGTSFSAPQVAGAVALVLEQRPNLSPDQVKWLLTQNERPLAGSNAGALDLGLVSAALARPAGNANQGLQWTAWAQPGENTSAFLNALVSPGSTQPLDPTEQLAQSLEGQGGPACQQAGGPAGPPAPPTPPAAATPTTPTAPGGPAAPAAPSPPTPPGAPAAPAAPMLPGLLATLAPPSAPTPPTPPASPAAAASGWQGCAGQIALAASAWASAAQGWGTKLAAAAADELRAAEAWGASASDWAQAGNPGNATSDLADEAAAWDSSESLNAAAWDAAAWDAAAWDAAAWDAAAWDAAAWDAAAWDAAAWDYSGNWDAAAWDAAAWDAAAWDAAAWD